MMTVRRETSKSTSSIHSPRRKELINLLEQSVSKVKLANSRRNSEANDSITKKISKSSFHLKLIKEENESTKGPSLITLKCPDDNELNGKTNTLKSVTEEQSSRFNDSKITLGEN